MPYLNMTFGQPSLPLEEEWVPLDIPDRRTKLDTSRPDMILPTHYDTRALGIGAYPTYMADSPVNSHPQYYSFANTMNKPSSNKFQNYMKPLPLTIEQQRQPPHIPSIYQNSLAPVATGSESSFISESIPASAGTSGYLVASPISSPGILPRPPQPGSSRLLTRLPSPPVEERVSEETVDSLSRDFLRFQALSNSICEIFDHQQMAVSIHLVSRLRGNWHLSTFEHSEIDPTQSRTRQLIFYRRNLFSVSTCILIKGLPATVRTGPSSVESISKLVCTLQLAQSAQRKRPASAAQRKRQSLAAQRKRQVDLVNQHGEPVSETEIIYTRQAETGDFEALCDWGKIKFSSATINNGAPSQQPYFQVVTTVSAVTQSGAKIALAQAISKPIIVRGRHPRFYKDRFGVALNAENPPRSAKQS